MGKETLDDVEYHRLTVHHGETDFDLWVTPGDTPRIGRIVPDTSDFGPSQGMDVTFTTAVAISEWEVNGAVASSFAF